MFGLLNPNGKIINIADSQAIEAYNNLPKAIQKRFWGGPTEAQLDELKKEYFKAVKEGKTEALGWYKDAYAMSKLFITSWTKGLGQLLVFMYCRVN